jgi:hypothetical protein
VLAGYPNLEREDIQQALGHAAWLAQEQVHIGWTAKERRAKSGEPVEALSLGPRQ